MREEIRKNHAKRPINPLLEKAVLWIRILGSSIFGQCGSGCRSRFWWENLKKFKVDIFFHFFDQNLQFTHPYWTFQLHEKPSALKREHPEHVYFFLFLGIIFAPLAPDPIPHSRCGSGSSRQKSMPIRIRITVEKIDIWRFKPLNIIHNVPHQQHSEKYII